MVLRSRESRWWGSAGESVSLIPRAVVRPVPVFPAAPLLHVSFLVTASDGTASMRQIESKKKAGRETSQSF